MTADGVVRPDEIPRLRQQVSEIDRTGPGLELLISSGRPGQFLLQTGGQVPVRVFLELLESGKQRVTRGQHFASQRVLAVFVASALARAGYALVTAERQVQLAEGLFEVDLTAETPHGVGIGEEVVARRHRLLAEDRQPVQQRQDGTDGCDAIEWGTPPRLRKIAPLGKRAAGAAKAIDRTVAVAGALEDGCARAPQGTTDAFRRVCQRLLQPTLESPRI